MMEYTLKKQWEKTPNFTCGHLSGYIAFSYNFISILK